MIDKTAEAGQTRTLTDPVCGMTVTETSEQHIHCADKDYYFCSSGCQNKFKANPEQYIKLPPDTDTQLKDPVCGMSVTAESDFHLLHDNHEYFTG